MTSWLDCIQDVRALRAVYGDHVPALDGVRMAHIAVDWDGRCVRVGFDLPEFPAVPPVKWREFTTVHVTLALYEVTDVRVDGLPVGEIADLALVRQDSAIALSLSGTGLDVAIRCGSVFLQKISAYQQGAACVPAPVDAVDTGTACRICGFDLEQRPAGTPGYLICYCCGAESGLDDTTRANARRYRSRWLSGGGEWFTPGKRPDGWILQEQLRRIPRDYI
jgi:hypothetical protein